MLRLGILLFAAAASAPPRSSAQEVPGGSVQEAGAEAATTTIVVARHAETAGDDPRDPSLSDAGNVRAAALVEALRGARIRAVFTSQYRRTRSTGKAVADAFGVPLRDVPITDGDIERYSRELLELILSEHAGGAVLVVGHSNTVPVLAEVATGRPAHPIAEGEYDQLFVLLRSDSTRVIRARYGPPSMLH